MGNPQCTLSPSPLQHAITQMQPTNGAGYSTRPEASNKASFGEQ